MLITSTAKWGIIFLLSLMYVVVGCLPYTNVTNFPNGASAGATQQSLIFESPGIAYSRFVPPWARHPDKIDSLSIELAVTPYSLNQNGPARIVTLSRNASLRNLTLGQSGADLVVRIRTSSSSPNGTPSISIPSVFSANTLTRITLDVRNSKVQISINGRNRFTRELNYAPFLTWAPDYRFAVGNEMTFDRPWLGEVSTLRVVANGADYDYQTNESLVLSDRYYLPPDLYLKHDRVTFALVVDWLVNLFGFLPLGFLAAVGIRHWKFAVFSGVAVSLVVSATIEVSQLWLPWRFSGLRDISLNVIGGGLGAILLVVARNKAGGLGQSVFRFRHEKDRISPDMS